MKNSILKISAITLLLTATISCMDKTATNNTTSAGTETYDKTTDQESEQSMSGNVDTITSPGSNVGDIKDGTIPAE